MDFRAMRISFTLGMKALSRKTLRLMINHLGRPYSSLMPYHHHSSNSPISHSTLFHSAIAFPSRASFTSFSIAALSLPKTLLPSQLLIWFPGDLQTELSLESKVQRWQAPPAKINTDAAVVTSRAV
ncbi:hypothetical protein COLO4_35905 [Corchorus olitorius]|uniref:Uncharacterized protein n=1 Tax=Corchorus olitorius TaxID=93759 RepID=A0A1R3GC46_9ROSI|nr:hypothetical protein COLO4_35905 [Corchorus olitorius]